MITTNYMITIAGGARVRAASVTMGGTGVDPAITGEPPEERGARVHLASVRGSARLAISYPARRRECAASSVEPDGAGPSQPMNERPPALVSP